MKVQINSKDLMLDAKFKQYVKRRIEFAFRRRTSEVYSVSVMLNDANGPRGGCDKVCKIKIKLAGLPEIIVKEQKEKIRVAINRAVTRAQITIERKIEKLQQCVRDRTLYQAVKLTA